MKKILLVILPVLSICTVCFGQSKSDLKNQQLKTSKHVFDSTVVTILPLIKNMKWLVKDTIPTVLSNKDLQKIEDILYQCIDTHNVHAENYYNDLQKKHPERKLKKKNFIIDLAKYKRQYMASLNSKGEKVVWVNCFCGTKFASSEYPVIVNDGGNCFFNLKTNLRTGKYYDFFVNGDA